VFDFQIIHSTVSGKTGPEQGLNSLKNDVAAALGGDGEKAIRTCGNREDLDRVVEGLIRDGVPRLAVSGGDGFSRLFYNVFFQMRDALQKHDYRPHFLFLAGGTGNAISCFTNFRNNIEALKRFAAREYKTQPLNLLEVDLNGQRELAHNVTFGGDGAVLLNYNAQKLKGLTGYIWAVVRYGVYQKYINPFSRRSGNFIVDIEDDGGRVHRGSYEGGGAAVVPFVGYRFKPYPMADNGMGHLRFVNFALWLMPTVFRFTNMLFPRGPKWLVFEKRLDRPNLIKFRFPKPVHVQVCGDYRDMHDSAQVRFAPDRSLDFVKKK